VKFLSPAALTGSLSVDIFDAEPQGALNLWSHLQDSFMGRGIFVTGWRADMPKAARISPSIPFSSTSQRSDTYELISVALFSGIGLLLSLAIVIAGVRGVWT
jgi:hypothetical protein